MKRPDPSRASRLLLLGLVFLVLPAMTIALVASRMDGEGSSAATLSSEGRGAPPPQPLAPDESYVRTVVLPSGDLRVTHWIESSATLLDIGLSLPAVTGAAGVEARNVRVLADGRRVSGTARITTVPASYPLLGARSVQVRYRLKGAVERSGASAPGRALALVTALDVTHEPPPQRVVRAILAPEVLSLACAPAVAEGAPEPCGALGPDGGWTVERAGARVDDRVLAQVSLR
ncbi:hypothetical protein [Nocardioides terrigena]|uniref:hypothetical protein n=1 Tax=Nocardioides terrigena TaxID=424797 RepID=UPI000D3224F8|nr:hypothetical protein [Nocardioides terrigena]